MTNKQDISMKYLATFGALIFFAAVMILTGYINELCQLSLTELSIVSGAVMIVALLYSLSLSKGYVWTVHNVYVFIFCVFHFGLILIYSFSLDVSAAYRVYLQKWFISYYGNYAIILVTIGLSALVAGIAFMQALGKGRSKNVEEPALDPRQDQVLTISGFLLVAVAVFAWFFLILSHGGVKVLTGSYQSFLRETESYLSGWYFYFPIGWGLITLAVASPSRLRRAGFLIFLLFALVALPLGLRGEVLFPAFAALAAAGMKGLALDLKKTVIIGIVLLCAISALRQIRHVGVDTVRFSEVSVTPFDSLAELGSSIRPVVEVVSWAGSGEGHIYGQSYWAPIDRLMVYFVPGWSRVSVQEDDRLLNVLVQERVGPIGFSPIAEAYRNFGRYGVAMVMFLTGTLVAWMDGWRPTQSNRLIAGFVLFPLLIQVRNAFVMVPANILVGFFILLVMRQFYKDKDRSTEKRAKFQEAGA